MARAFLIFLSIFFIGGCSQNIKAQTKNMESIKAPIKSAVAIEKPLKLEDLNISNDSFCNNEEIDATINSNKNVFIDRYPQDISYYIDNFTKNDNNISRYQAQFFDRFYSPWSFTRAPKDKSTLTWPTKVFKSGFGSNLLPIKKETISWWHKNINLSEYGTINKRAMVIRYSDIRSLPTEKPLFRDPRIAGEGYPFDQLQNSSATYAEAVFVSHYSLDRAWVFIYSSSVSGWIKSENIAFIDDKKISNLKNSKKLFVKKDNLPIYRLDGEFVDYSRVGMVLSYLSEDDSYFYAKSIDKNGDFIRISLPKDAAHIGFSDLNRDDISIVLSQLLKNSYGWGGFLGERDCSSMIRDYAIVFGMMLPRNSAAQAMRGEKISLKDMSSDDKKSTIKELAIPFETIAYLRGHVLLYVGVYENEPLFIHNIWGVRTKDDMGRNGRHIIGRAIISSLDLGVELADHDPEGLLIDRLESINIFTRVATKKD